MQLKFLKPVKLLAFDAYWYVALQYGVSRFLNYYMFMGTKIYKIQEN